ncbi:adenylyl-sulfate kinase [Vibrio campbellii]|nr:adenylyl-sulfate kinase [Vibrio campbellii]
MSERIRINPGLIWITGLSGSGKTTLSIMLSNYLQEQYGVKVVSLDGDELRVALDVSNHYSKKDRAQLAKSYSRLGELFVNQGFCTICSTVSMFDEVRKYNRQQNENYCEIFLDVDDEIRSKRKNIQSITKEDVIASRDFQFPHNSDFKLVNPKISQLEAVCHRIADYLLSEWK